MEKTWKDRFLDACNGRGDDDCEEETWKDQLLDAYQNRSSWIIWTMILWTLIPFLSVIAAFYIFGCIPTFGLSLIWISPWCVRKLFRANE